MELADDVRDGGGGELPLGPAPTFPSSQQPPPFPIPGLPRAGPQSSAGEDLAGAGHSLAVWSKDLITLSTFDDSLGLLNVNLRKGNVYSCAQKQTLAGIHAPD